MIIYLIKLTLILIFNTCVSIYYINSECCCKKEPQANNMLRSESCCKSCKDNKSQDNNNRNDETKRNINHPKHNKLNNKNNDDLIERNEEGGEEQEQEQGGEEGGEGEKKKKDDKKEEENKIKLEEEQKRIEEENKIKLEEQPEEQPEEQEEEEGGEEEQVGGEEEQQVGGKGEKKEDEEKEDEEKEDEEKEDEEKEDEEKKEENKDEEKKEENKDEEKKVGGKDDKKDDENKIKLEKEKLEKERIEKEKLEKEKKEEEEKKKKEIEELKKECTNKLDSVLDENKDFLYYLENQEIDAVHTEKTIENNKKFLGIINNLKEEISEKIKNLKSQDKINDIKDKINDINESIKKLNSNFKLKLVQRIVQFFHMYKENKKILLNKWNKIIEKVDKIKPLNQMEYATYEENKKRDEDMKEIAKENDAEELFKLYKEILDLNIEVQKERYKNLERQKEEKYNEEKNELIDIINGLNDLNKEILKCDNSNEHYMTTAPKNIYQNLSDIVDELKNLNNRCEEKNIKIENIPKYNDFKKNNSFVLENRKKIEEKYFDKKKTYLSEDKKRRSKIFNTKTDLNKYEKKTNTDVKRSTYVQNLYNVPFLSEYNGFGEVLIPFAFELTKDYKEIFPKKMIDEVEKKLEEHGINSNKNFHIFFCYQYILKILDKNAQLLFRPHYFIAKREIDEKYNTLLKEEKNAHKKASYKGCTTYNEIQKFNPNKNKNTCIFYDSEHCIINKDIDNFSVHDGDLSYTIPMVDLIPKDKSQINKTYVYYSFVLEQKKKIAALTIHFLCFPIEEGRYNSIVTEMSECDFYEKNNTIGSAINFATANGDTEVVEFLNQITK